MSSEEQRSKEQWLAEFLNVLSVPFVKLIAESFFENVRQIEALLTMPTMLFGFLEVETEHRKIYKKVALSDNWSEKGHAMYQEYLTRELDAFNVRDIPDWLERSDKRIAEALHMPTVGPVLHAAMTVLHHAAVSGCWTALECVASDLWVAALNHNPVPLAQRTIASLESDGGDLNSKQISVGLAARYGFDLRHSLGSILKPKFDFTSVSGIQKAYEALGLEDLGQVLDDPVLKKLEVTRHLIVHRAGKVDEEYRRRTKSVLELGTALNLSSSEVTEFAAASQKAGTGLLAWVNDWSAGIKIDKNKDNNPSPSRAGQH